MDLDFDAIEKVSDFISVPEGTYLCEIAEVQTGVTRNGDERWGLRLVIVEGEYCGRHAAWDGLVFSTRGQIRVRLVLEALGLPTKGRVQLKPEDLIGCKAFVEVRPSEYQHPDSGQVIRRNEVPYRGYRSLASGAPGSGAGGTPEKASPDAADGQSDPASGAPISGDQAGSGDQLPF